MFAYRSAWLVAILKNRGQATVLPALKTIKPWSVPGFWSRGVCQTWRSRMRISRHREIKTGQATVFNRRSTLLIRLQTNRYATLQGFTWNWGQTTIFWFLFCVNSGLFPVVNSGLSPVVVPPVVLFSTLPYSSDELLDRGVTSPIALWRRSQGSRGNTDDTQSCTD